MSTILQIVNVNETPLPLSLYLLYVLSHAKHLDPGSLHILIASVPDP